jgi:hypothetical protein
MKFLALYGDRILLSGETIVEVLQKFNELPVIICDGELGIYKGPEGPVLSYLTYLFTTRYFDALSKPYYHA